MCRTTLYAITVYFPVPRTITFWAEICYLLVDISITMEAGIILCLSGPGSLRMFSAHHQQDGLGDQYVLDMLLHIRKVSDVLSHPVKSCASCHAPMVGTSSSPLSTAMEVDPLIVDTPQPQWMLAGTELVFLCWSHSCNRLKPHVRKKSVDSEWTVWYHTAMFMICHMWMEKNTCVIKLGTVLSKTATKWMMVVDNCLRVLLDWRCLKLCSVTVSYWNGVEGTYVIIIIMCK